MSWRTPAKAKPIVSATERRYVQFANTYQSWRDALSTACEMLFNLNRHAKHESCSPKHKEVIYDLKNKFIQLLYTEGFSTECYEHSFETRTRYCFRCFGDGCYRCGYAGIYAAGKMLSFVCFTFEVGGKKYCWHQPSEIVDFPFTVTTENKTWERDEGDTEKPITLAATKFAEAKDMLRWILAQAKQEREAVPALATTDAQAEQMLLFPYEAATALAAQASAAS